MALSLNGLHAFSVNDIAYHLISVWPFLAMFGAGQFWKARLPKSGLFFPSAEAYRKLTKILSHILRTNNPSIHPLGIAGLRAYVTRRQTGSSA